MGIRIQNNAENREKYGAQIDRNFTIRSKKSLELSEVKELLGRFYELQAAKTHKQVNLCYLKDCCCDRIIKAKEEALESLKRVYDVTYFSDTAHWGA